MMFPTLALVIPLALLGYHVTPGQGVDRLVYQQVFQMSLLPRDTEVNKAQAHKAILELITAHYNMARGIYYPIGTATGLFSGRKKRFANFGSSFGSDWGSSSRYDPWGSFPFSNFGKNSYSNNDYHPDIHYNQPTKKNTNTHYSGNTYSSFGGNNRQIIHCPAQANQSAVYMLNSSSTAYPSTDIGNEFFARSLPGSDLFFQCAIRRAILPDTGPTVDVDQNFVTANHTCPSTDLTLFNYMYQNTAIGGRCWVVQGFQEPVLFSVCQQKSCTNCKLKPTPRAQSSSYSHHHVQQDYSTRNVTVNQCLQEYRTTQVLSYCENLPINQRIIYDRIIIPLSCSCKSVDCMTNPHW